MENEEKVVVDSILSAVDACIEEDDALYVADDLNIIKTLDVGENSFVILTETDGNSRIYRIVAELWQLSP